MRQHAITPAQTFGKRMTFVEAAAEVLRLAGKPLHYKEITDIAVEKGLLSHVGKSPEVTMGARLAALLKKDDPDTSLVRVRPGVFGLKSYDTKPAAAEAPAPAEPQPASTFRPVMAKTSRVVNSPTRYLSCSRQPIVQAAPPRRAT